MEKGIRHLLNVSIALLFSGFLISCGTNGAGSSIGGTATGKVALYATDDMSLDYEVISATINKVELLHTGSDATCELLNTPVTLDITDLSSIIQLINIQDCSSENYNRIRIEINKSLELQDMSGAKASCMFTSYKDKNDHPNVLQCSGDNCHLDMNGAVNVLSSQTEKFALDFDLKKFEVRDFDLPTCSVTMKVAPLRGSDIDDKKEKGYREGVAGFITDIDSHKNKFNLSTNSGTFTVHMKKDDDIDGILDHIIKDKSEVMIQSPDINVQANQIHASAIHIVKQKKPLAKNIIVMISDGWGFNHLDAASYYEYGKDARQIYNRFPFNFAMSTYMAYYEGDNCYNHGYDFELAWSSFDYVKSCSTDSAAAATALSTGVKTYQGAVGVDLNKQPLIHAIEVAEELGKATGVVSTVQFSHATPASFVAHNENRSNYEEIANEMIYESAVDVIMGAGHPWYDADGQLKNTPNTFKYVGGESTWNDLIAGTAGNDADADGIDDPWNLIQTVAEFQALASGDAPKRVIGVPQIYRTLQQERSGDSYADPYVVPPVETVPTLEEMTKAALNVLDDDPEGLFLMIEGGAIDWASHDNQSGRMIEEQIDFERSVEAVVEWVKKNSNWGETLLVVTGDHETGYLTGPGSDPTWEPIVNKGVGNLPGMQWNSEGHTNSLMVLSAKGDAARLMHYFANERDLVRGHFVDNADVGEMLFWTLDPMQFIEH